MAWYVYNAWGYPIGSSGWFAEINPLRYRGYYWDSALGMYYLNSRFYDPFIGRFINADAFLSTGQGLLGFNAFVYCLNNPVMRIDPTGYVSMAGWSQNMPSEAIIRQTAAVNAEVNRQLNYMRRTGRDPTRPAAVTPGVFETWLSGEPVLTIENQIIRDVTFHGLVEVGAWGVAASAPSVPWIGPVASALLSFGANADQGQPLSEAAFRGAGGTLVVIGISAVVTGPVGIIIGGVIVIGGNWLLDIAIANPHECIHNGRAW